MRRRGKTARTHTHTKHNKLKKDRNAERQKDNIQNEMQAERKKDRKTNIKHTKHIWSMLVGRGGVSAA